MIHKYELVSGGRALWPCQAAWHDWHGLDAKRGTTFGRFDVETSKQPKSLHHLTYALLIV